MADLEGNLAAKDFGLDRPQQVEGFHIKGASQLDFGMRHRLSRIFGADGRTVMLAFDHGYFQGPTSGLERVDLNIVPLAPYADALMATRGIIRSVIPASCDNALVVRASGGPSILNDLSDERIAMDITDAVRMDAAAVAVQVFIGSDHETQSIHNLTQLVDAGLGAGVPVLGVTAVGRDMVRDARYLGLATRIIAELGAQLVKTYYCEDFAQVTAACPVPIIMAGGKKLPVLDALNMARKAVDEGAAGVDMGRNIFQRRDPHAMLQAVRSVVHDEWSPEKAAELYRDLSHGAED
ncbi:MULTISPECIES: 3-hydroxy-5-phosphonooxypentane-2,4-dione thiolase [unclassified Nocardioides]|uniref:3-hydroxy-5-phosphonooxypentane-2,4-dione thiolase n=1 Tax=unclassified Nocardioides TaxID=2615069 RepID=UPI0000571BDB|nr:MULTISPECIES: 3-hydroxy-5-phosphonooxypentane-2,4-dione thiolase [unclassified Nocardioides]ABL79942.1 deoxyribose-phosphate aldolase/phospho-2-dehydro-3-deoxyheptonate aldolase [Nocardioides sp. JS614]